MITKIIHQIWNERKQNAWLFLELIVAIIFLWLAIDPLFTLVCRNNLPKGYTHEKVYRVKYEAFVTDPSSYQASENNKAEFLSSPATPFNQSTVSLQISLTSSSSRHSTVFLKIKD